MNSFDSCGICNLCKIVVGWHFFGSRPACDRKLPFILRNSAEIVFLDTLNFILLSKLFNFEE